MDYQLFKDTFQNVPVYIWILLAIGFLSPVIRLFWGAKIKGWVGEKTTTHLGLRRLDNSTYSVYDDLYLSRVDGQGTTQLDHVVVSSFGIFVVETKNYKGWIFGSEEQRQWTVSIGKKKFRFQNPIHQNELHIRALGEFLKLDRDSFLSIVFFVGECELKTGLPPNVLNKGLRRYITSFQSPVFNDNELERINDNLLVLDASHDRSRLSKAHVESLKKRAGTG